MFPLLSPGRTRSRAGLLADIANTRAPCLALSLRLAATAGGFATSWEPLRLAFQAGAGWGPSCSGATLGKASPWLSLPDARFTPYAIHGSGLRATAPDPEGPHPTPAVFLFKE